MTRFIAVIALFSAAATAATVTITTSGAYSSSALVSTYSAPNVIWALTFQVANPPTVTATGTGTFTTTYTNGVFTLNGTPITLTGSNVIFQSGGGFEILLDSATAFRQNDEETQEFSGTTSNPTIVPGIYTFTVFQLFQYPSGTPIVLYDPSTVVVITASGSTPTATPLPSAFVLTAIGFSAVALWMMFYRKRSVS